MEERRVRSEEKGKREEKGERGEGKRGNGRGREDSSSQPIRGFTFCVKIK